MLELIQGLSDASDLFRQFWEEQQVLWWEGNEKTFNHPQRGLLTFFQTTFLAAPDPTLKLVILKPCCRRGRARSRQSTNPGMVRADFFAPQHDKGNFPCAADGKLSFIFSNYKGQRSL